MFVARLSTGKTIGGYTSLATGFHTSSRRNTYETDRSAFIFSLTNKYKHTQTATSGTNAIYRRSTYGPTMGGGHDIYIQNVTEGRFSESLAELLVQEFYCSGQRGSRIFFCNRPGKVFAVFLECNGRQC